MVDTNRLQKTVTALLESPTLEQPAAKRALAQLRQAGAVAIPGLLDLVGRNGHSTQLEEALGELLSLETLPVFLSSVESGPRKTSRVVCRLLAKRADRVDTRTLTGVLGSTGLTPRAIRRILAPRFEGMAPDAVLEAAVASRGELMPVLFRLVADRQDAEVVPALVARLESGDAAVRAAAARGLASCETKEARGSLVRILVADPESEVRLAALEALLASEQAPPRRAIGQLLRDPDENLRRKAVGALAGLPETMALDLLTDLLRDGSPAVREEAVAVLGQLATPTTVRPLLAALADDEWAVRSRAAETIARLGGPELVGSLLECLRDGDSAIRQTAAQILEQRFFAAHMVRELLGVKRPTDVRTLECLIDALKDEAPAVRERAIEALASLRDRRAVPALLPLMQGPTEHRETLITALGELGDPRAVPAILQTLHEGDQALSRAALLALEKLVDEEHGPEALVALDGIAFTSGDYELRRLCEGLVEELERRFGRRPSTAPVEDDTVEAPSPPELPASGGPPPEAASEPEERSHTIEMPTHFDPGTLQRGELLAGRYRVVRQLARGGYGVLVLVVDQVAQEEIVLKFLGPHLAGDPKAIERFKRELRHARRITHENVIRIYDIIPFGSSLAISMEYFPSSSLGASEEDGQSIDVARGLRVMRQVCLGLAVAHRAEVIHRDLKPGNILIDERDRVKLVDFGLASALNKSTEALTRTGLIVGTPRYMSPEQIRGKAIDARTDVYSLGIVMYELFTGEPPYDGDDSMGILFQHIEGKAREPRRVNPEIPDELEALIMKSMARNPDDRFQTADELRAHLLGVMGRLAV